jgi:hypothetical protein
MDGPQHLLGNSIIYDNGTNVGIGTTNPGVWFNPSPVLHLSGSHPTLRFSPTSAGGLASIVFKGTFNTQTGSSPDELNLFYVANSTSSALHLYSYQAGTYIFSILGNGNVGIGTMTPGYKLDVVGDIRTSGTYRVGGSAGLSADLCLSCGGGSCGCDYLIVRGGIVVGRNNQCGQCP